MDRAPGSAYRYAPDGLVGKALEDLIARAYAEVVNAPVPTSALLDGSAGEQLRRRMERRAVTAGCVLLESRPAHGLIGSNPRQGKSAMSAQRMARLVATGGDGAGEVA